MWRIEELALGFASGVAQGVFEWLPVSSKTILLFIFYWFGTPPSQAYFIGLFLNGSTAAAAALYFRKDLVEALRGLYEAKSRGRLLLAFLIVSTLATGVTAIPLASLAAEALSSLGRFSMILIAILFSALTIILWIEEKLGEKKRGSRSLKLSDGILAGLAQGFSALPGMSRSGLTIFALLALGYEPSEAVKLSFLMSIPATIGGSLYTYLLHRGTITTISSEILAVSIITALTISILTIATLIKLSQKIKPHLFTLTLAIISLATALLQT